MGNQSTNIESVRETLSASFSSTGFWSVIAAVVGVFAVVAGIVLALSIEEIRNYSIAVLIIGLALLFIALVLSPQAVAMFMVGRRGRYGTNVAVMTVAFFAIVVLVNFLLFRTSTRFDTTATRIFTLSPKTVQVLERLPSPVRANAFFVPGDAASGSARQRAEDLLNEFSRKGPNFTYRFVDPQLERGQALKYSVTDFPTVVFEDIDQGSQQAVAEFSEQDFLTSIVIATGIERKKVYYLTGHKEAARTRDRGGGNIDPDGFDFAIEGMQRDNYAVRALNLQQDDEVEVPRDAAVLIIAGPKNNLGDDEREAIIDYLLDGGKLVALMDPGHPCLLPPASERVGSPAFDRPCGGRCKQRRWRGTDANGPEEQWPVPHQWQLRYTHRRPAGRGVLPRLDRDETGPGPREPPRVHQRTRRWSARLRPAGWRRTPISSLSIAVRTRSAPWTWWSSCRLRAHWLAGS